MIDKEYNQEPIRTCRGVIVYEIPVEGNITRYMAIFHHNHADK
jgi:hypothetical protein